MTSDEARREMAFQAASHLFKELLQATAGEDYQIHAEDGMYTLRSDSVADSPFKDYYESTEGDSEDQADEEGEEGG